jgi:hypothetical protein
MMWVLLALAGAELLVVHFLLALWSPGVAMFVSVLTLAGMIWFAALIASFRRLPVLIEGDTLTMRVGRLRVFRLPFTAIAGLRPSWTGDDLKRRNVSNLALIAYPNIWIDLVDPVVGRRGSIIAIAHKLDDPQAFSAALGAKLERPA